jgi:hypothetical protein
MNVTPAELTRILFSVPQASFVRLGDGELRFLIECQDGAWADGKYDKWSQAPSPDNATGTLGLRRCDYDRLLAAYEQSYVVDDYSKQDFNSLNLPRLRWQRRPDGVRASSGAHDSLLLGWVTGELFNVIRSQRVLICSAESALLAELLTDRDYRKAISTYIPEGFDVRCLVPVGGGLAASTHLLEQKAALLDLIKRERIELLLLGLGGCAKILCYEVAAETGVPAVDFGSMVRALTFSGSDGFAAWRASHNPFLARVPLRTYFPALVRSAPRMDAGWLLGKAHAQLLLNLQRREVGRTYAADPHSASSLSLDEENVAWFAEDFEFFRREIEPRLGAASGQAYGLYDWMIRNRVPVDVPYYRKIQYYMRRAPGAVCRRLCRACGRS